MLAAVCSGFVLSCLIPWFVKPNQNRFWSWVLSILPFVLFVYFLSFLPEMIQGEKLYFRFPWFNAAGVNLSFCLDGLSWLFALLITGIGTLIVIYSGAYFDAQSEIERLYSYLFIFMASMLGLVLSNNLITLFVFWELTSLTSFLLIGFQHEKTSARKAAFQALFITVVGGLALLAGFILIWVLTDTFELDVLLAQQDVLRQNPHYLTVLFLILIGAFTKSAQFPFHIWLPKAMEAPTPISAYLHSATMVKAGIYLLARMHPLLSETVAYFVILSSVGGVTMLLGAVQGIRQTDMKSLLAYTTIMALGSLVFLLGSHEENSIKAAIVFLLSHALYKAGLFMAVGDIQMRTQTRNLRHLHGLRKVMPVTFIIVLITAASMSGLPPLLGYYVKELVYEANLAAPIASQILIGTVLLSNMMLAMLGLLLIIKPFFGKDPDDLIKEADPQMLLGGVLLALMTVILSFVPLLLYQVLIEPALSTIMPTHIHVKMHEISFSPALTPSFALSIITFFGAIILYLSRNWVRQASTALNALFSHYGPDYLYYRFMEGIALLAHWQTRWIQCGLLRVYLGITFLTVAVVLLFASFFYPGGWPVMTIPEVNWISAFLALSLIVCAFSTLAVRSYFSGLVFLGLLGMMNALIFLTSAAPDVAMTQVLVETLVVVIVALNFYKQPLVPNFERDVLSVGLVRASIAILSGMAITILLLNVLQIPLDLSVNQYYLQNSLSFGKGSNVVNAILVNFRSLDTLGEILVIGVAALGIYGLLQSKFTRGGE